MGKSYFYNLAKESTEIETYSASTLIAAKKQSEFSMDRLIPDIDDNQQFLLIAVNELKTGFNVLDALPLIWNITTPCSSLLERSTD